jgi:hypothetical protein
VNHVLAESEKVPSVDVPVTRLDDLLGHDVPVVIMETNGSGVRYGVSDDELIALMQQHGFASYSYDPFARRLADVTVGSGNTVFVKNKAAVEARVKAAPTFSLVNGKI